MKTTKTETIPMNRLHANLLESASTCVPFKRQTLWVAGGSGLAACILLMLAALMPAWGQQVTIVGQPVRVTVPVSSSISVGISNIFTVTTNGLNQVDANGNWVVGPINLSAAGLPTTLAGVTFTFTDPKTNPITSFTPVISTNNANVTTNIWLWVNVTNAPEGVYSFSINASGAATDTLLLTLQVAHIWTGAAFTNGGTADFSNPGNWSGGNVPGPASDVVFTDSGGVGSGVTTTNVLIATDTEIGSFRQAITQSGTRRHNIQINNGVTLKITGTNGFSAGLRDRSDTSQAWELAATGSNGTLMVSNVNADLNLFGMYNQVGSLFLNQLGTFIADVHQLNISDYRAYPNYDSLLANNYPSSMLPRQMAPGVNNFAQTNIIRCWFPGDTNNWQDPAIRDYSVVIGRNLSAGTTQRRNTQLGIYNYFAINSICIAGFGVAMDQSSGSLRFNPGFATNNPIAIFRNTNGTDRVSMFAIADGATPGSSSSSTKAIVDFSGGTVDALVDKLYLARDRTNANGGFSAATLNMGNGTFDANDVILGYQGNGNNYGNNEDYCQGTLTIASNGVFRVNDAIDLGYTTADATNNSTASANAATGYGQINVNNGGTLIANVIRVGGVTKLSGNNTITLNGGTLIVSNTIAGTDKALTSLTVQNGGTLTLFINGADTTPRVYTTNLVTSGLATIAIGDITGLTLPAQVPIIQYASGTPTFALSLPPGYSGALINNGPGSTIDAFITSGAPKNLLWRGYVSSDWDTTTKNWLDMDTGLHTNFVNLDNVAFDDAAGVPGTVNLAMANLIPGSIMMTNTTLNYTFSGSGTTVGAATLTKTGTGTLDIESATTLSVDLQQGLLTGAGTINSAVVGSSAVMDFSGTVNAGVTAAGLVINPGTINGAVDVQAGGVFTNLSNINGPITLESGAFMDNSGTINNMLPTGTVASNAFLLNRGTISDSSAGGGGTLNVAGTLEDTGVGSMTLFRLNIQPGGLFIPGGDGIGTTTIYSDGIGTFPGRLSFNAGSTVLLKVDPGVPANTLVRSGALDYGGSSSQQNQNGGTLVITNVGTTPFAAGQVFNLFDNAFGGDNPISTGTSTNTFPVIVPPTPGPGLSWDLSHLWPGGRIGVIPTPFVTLTNKLFVQGTNIIGQFSWDSAYRGWRLESQVNPASVGLSTNWTGVSGSWTNTSVTITNVLGTNAVFFRLVYP